MSGSGVDRQGNYYTSEDGITWQVALGNGDHQYGSLYPGDKMWSEAHDGGHVCINALNSPYWHVTHINYKGEVKVHPEIRATHSFGSCCWVGAPHNHYLAFENKGDSTDNRAHDVFISKDLLNWKSTPLTHI